MQDRPTAAELLRAAREFCEQDLLPTLDGRRRFHTRVLVNVLGILEREWGQEEQAVEREWRRLRELLGSAEAAPSSFGALIEQTRKSNAELSARIRSGAQDECWKETLTALRESVSEKLAIANPGYSDGA